MFGTIRKHQTWLWVIIIAFMSVGLVFVFNPASRYSGRGGGTANHGSIEGVDITQEAFRNAWAEAQLRYFFIHKGQWPGSAQQTSDFDENKETYQWLFVIQKLNDYNIHVDNESVAKAAANILRSVGQGHAVSLDVFVQQILGPRGLTAEDFQRYLQHDLAFEQLLSLIGLSGELVPPAEAEMLYRRENQEIATEAAFFSSSNYLAQVAQPTPQALLQFYTNSMASYRIPKRVQVRYVAFGITNQYPEVEKELTNLNESVDATMDRYGTNYLQIASTREEAKQRIREELLHQQAEKEARREAFAFTDKLLGMKPQPESLVELARTNGLTAKITEPFSSFGPDEFNGGPQFVSKAFALTPDQPFDGPIVSRDAVYVIALQTNLPSEVPPYHTIQNKVATDYRHSEALQLARQAGERLYVALTNGLAAGKTFDAVCASAHVDPVKVPPMSLDTQSSPTVEKHIYLYQYKQAAFFTRPGEVSHFAPTTQGGFIVNVERRLPVDETKMKAQLPEFVDRMRRTLRQEAAGVWLQREAGQALASTPLGRPQQPSLPADGTQ